MTKIYRRTLPQLVLVPLALIANAAIGCKFAYQEPTGFIGSEPRQFGGGEPKQVQHLPANARGVLFVRPSPGGYWLRNRGEECFFRTSPSQREYVFCRNPSQGASVQRDRGLEGFLLLRSLPTPLRAASFSIEETGGKQLTPVVSRVEVSAQLPRTQSRIFVARNPRLADCARENIASLDGCEEIEKNVRKLIKSGKLVESTAKAKLGYGLFRISPKEGFVPGREYVVRYTGDAGESPWMYPSTAFVKIDKTPAPPLSISIGKDPRDKKPRSDLTALRYRMNSALEPYRKSMYFFTHTRLIDTGKGNEHRFGTGTITMDRPSCGQSYLLLGQDLGQGDFWSERLGCREISGYAALFEVDDKIARAAPIRLDCKN
jgi:hypothetical protein